jgi:F-type H+-transporting ATPase subunit b
MILAGAVNPSKNTCKRVLHWAFCIFFLLIFAGPVVLAAQANPDPQEATSQPASTTAQAAHQSKLQAERRAEIRQRKIDNPEAQEGENVYRHSAMVQKIAGIFGLSVETTSRLFEIVNFILLVILIVWGVGKILPKALRARTERIRNEIEQARVATEDANRRLASVEERLARLDSEIDSIRTQAEHETVIEEKRLREVLEQEKQSILASAAQDIDAATKNAQSQLKKLAADLVIEHAKRQIVVSPEADQTLVAGFLTDLDEKHPRGGVN